MSTDTLTEAVANLESAWRRLREVLDGPDVAAALVEASSKPRPMSTAPRDRTPVTLHFADGECTLAYFSQAYDSWRDGDGTVFGHPVGWSPVK